MYGRPTNPNTAASAANVNVWTVPLDEMTQDIEHAE